MENLKEKVCIITGAASGIGKAIAMLFVSKKMKLVIADIHQSELESLAKILNENGGNVTAVLTDVSKESDIMNLISKTLDKYGKLDILINNAGVMDNFTPVVDVTDELWNKVIGVNLNGVFYACREAVKIMLKNGGGDIINIASIGGLFGGRAGVAYTASKHAIVGLTKNIAYDYAIKGIRCNAIAPGGVETNITKGMEPNKFGYDRMNLGAANNIRTAKPMEVAEIALFLTEEKSKFINGSIITADGGWTAY